MEGKDKLTDKQQAFVREYLVDFSATQAAIRAGYSKKTAYSIGQENLRKPEIRQVLARRCQQLAHEADMTVERVFGELASIAFANMADYAKWSDDGLRLVASGDLTREQSSAVQEISQRATKYGTQVRFKLHDKIAALGKLEKYLELGQMGMVSWRDVLEALAEMARIVELYVSDPDILDKIKSGWSNIPIRPQSFGRS